MLLAISNDLSLRALKTNRWKSHPKMGVCGVRADSGPWHCLSIDREAPRPLGSRLCIGHGSGCCWTNPRLTAKWKSLSDSGAHVLAGMHRMPQCGLASELFDYKSDLVYHFSLTIAANDKRGKSSSTDDPSSPWRRVAHGECLVIDEAEGFRRLSSPLSGIE
jgi:hypothetical protein